MAIPVLRVESLCKSFGGVHAIRDLSFDVSEAQILGLIGPNGSGKSTTVNSLAGLFPITSGAILLGGTKIDNLPEYDRVARGLSRTFQTASTFTEFSVRDHVMLGCNVTRTAHPLSSIFGIGRKVDEEHDLARRVDQILEITDLMPLQNNRVGTISSAQQRFLMIATALASNPKVILLDEPAAGLVSHERKTLSDLIRKIRDMGTSVLVIEHHMALIMEVCDQIVVLNFGQKIAEGTPAEIRSNPVVIDAYLGEAV